ncbi:unnamed protein product [Paramecium pentaurelia]|uniref:Uncharacterized protein n=1 Tax=Paramecium pentaurelia TaxID=43138 RepID=A0A8S1U1X4_9CILI|nr:unnamed protein product [Paramecium pentaurelia]
MAKDFYVLSKQSSQQCFSSLGNFESIQHVNDSNKWDDIKQSRQDLMKKYHQFKTNEVKQPNLSTYQSQKVMIPKIENFDIKLNIKRDTAIKNKDKENILCSQQKQQERSGSNSQRIRYESVYDRLYNLRDAENKGTKVVQKILNHNNNNSQKQSKSILGHNILIQKRSSDPSILMPISSLIKKTQKQQIDQQQDQKNTQNQIHNQQNNSQDLYRVNVSRQQVCHLEKNESIKQNQSTEIQSNLNLSQIPIKHCYFSLINAEEKLQNKKVRSLSSEKNKTKQSFKSQKGNRAHTQGKQENKNQQKINRLYEYILEGNY